MTAATADTPVRPPSGAFHHLVVNPDGRRCATAVIDHLAEHGRAPDVDILVIATPARQRMIVEGLRERGLDPSEERFRFRDAQDALERVLGPDGAMSLEAYRDEFAEPLLAADGPVVAYGELVDLLVRRGDVTGALAIEAVCEELRPAHDLHILCGYEAETFDAGHLDLDTALARHGHVLAYEHPSVEVDHRDPLRAVAQLHRHHDERGAALRSLRTELQRVQHQRADRDRAAAMAVHDLRTPISVIVALLGMLRDSGGRLTERQLEECLDAASRSAQQLERLVSDLLLVAQLDGGGFRFELSSVDLRQLIANEAADARQLSGRAIEVCADDGLPAVWADPGRQRQIITNLVTNAIRFSASQAPIEIRLVRRDDVVAVDVEDRGRGIDADHLDEVFEPFNRLGEVAGSSDAPPGGTGLGLSITKALVEGQGGTISVVSEPGRGSTFTYTVPVADG